MNVLFNLFLSFVRVQLASRKLDYCHKLAFTNEERDGFFLDSMIYIYIIEIYFGVFKWTFRLYLCMELYSIICYLDLEYIYGISCLILSWDVSCVLVIEYFDVDSDFLNKKV